MKKTFKIIIQVAAYLSVSACTIISLLSCSLAPEFKLPKMDSTAKFANSLDGSLVTQGFEEGENPGKWKEAEPAAANDRGEWWKVFQDEKLNSLIEKANENNLDVQMMAARVKQARENISIVGGELFPSLTSQAGMTRSKPNSQTFGFPAPAIAPYNVYNVGLGLNYELDLFGQVQDKKRAASGEMEAAESARKSVQLAMQADVAAHYFGVKTLDSGIELQKKIVAAKEENLNLQRKKLELGSISNVDIAGDVIGLETSKSELKKLQQQREETKNSLAVLLAENPSSFKIEDGSLSAVTPNIPETMPSKVLERRPDISAAQRSLYAANARIGVARAAFFPDITLTARGGLESTELSDVFDWSNKAWSLGPLLYLPIFEGGRAIANLDRSKAAYEEGVASYKKQVLLAFKDVEDSISMINTVNSQSQSQKLAEDASNKAFKAMESKFNVGDISKIEYNAAQVANLEIAKLGQQVKWAKLNAHVQLIRAIGGGW